MGSITNRSTQAERREQKKVQDRKAELLGKPGLNKANLKKSIESGTQDGHTLDRGAEKNL